MSDRLYFSVPDECDNMLAQRFLRDKCGLSARIITRLKREKDGILMDGKILRTIDCVQSGKTVSIAIPDEKCEIEPTKGTLDIRYEDEHFLVVNKPHSMPVHPVKQHQSDTLANIVSYYCSQNGKPFVFRAINRLDKDTSGLVLIAKNRFTANAVKNKTHKVYYALCEGEIYIEGVVDKPMDLRDDSKMVRIVRDDGMKAVTHYKPLVATKVSNMAIMDITDIEPLLMAVYELLQESGIFVFATQHPCFVTLTEKYMTPHSYYDIAIEGQPKEQIYYHRSIQDIFNLCFRAGFVIDGFYEECFKTNKEIPMVMIVRLKKVKRDSLK